MGASKIDSLRSVVYVCGRNVCRKKFIHSLLIALMKFNGGGSVSLSLFDVALFSFLTSDTIPVVRVCLTRQD
jgi:hypothetical protein